ncbi:hypothetical protein Fleli_2956 [Bernardetia litoralis DSM 6794]|uniref:Tc1-like transposase DDE domain-containing protein n=1 Tax=Bernardetia litoralis (strain ATCC 23117 / DSM 6794 / NBRC 15988 / NCIMB 1366 / Fx l1 / Sio-4) TaxID=880071 RepID=I4AMW8_BERLS|nr:transposase [Bernardetia litoralis]AFM05303.1 hypothetical protein Fleli_2956 [Bernardetia litoralis DSM 6794]
MDSYQVTRQLIIRWFNRYEKEGIAELEATKGQGRRPILRIDNEEEMNKVESLVEASPQSLKVVVSQWEEELGTVLIFYLPSYSLHLNLIETLWRKIKIECLRPQDFMSKEDLHQAVKKYSEKIQ